MGRCPGIYVPRCVGWLHIGLTTTLNTAAHCRVLTNIVAGQLSGGQVANVAVDHYGSDG